MPTDMRRGFEFASAQASPGVVFGGVSNLLMVYEKMGAIDRAAADLDGKIRTYSRDPSLRASWAAWYVHWQHFYDGYKSDYARLSTLPGALVLADELDAKTNEEWRQYVQYQQRYQAERDPATGLPLPAPITPLPVIPPAPSTDNGGGKGWSVPTWLWVLLGVGVVGVGVYAYVQYREIKAGFGVARRVIGGAPKAEGDARRDSPLPSLEDYARGRDPFLIAGALPPAPRYSPPLSRGGSERDCRCSHERDAYPHVDYESDFFEPSYR